MAFILYNANKCGIETSDCTIRAISTILHKSWLETYWDICTQGAIECKMPSTNSVWGKYLLNNGFRRMPVDSKDNNVTTFCRYHPTGEYILATGTHVIAVINGDYYDIWDSGREIPKYYFTKES